MNKFANEMALDFLNSSDVKEHLKKIKHKFTMVEAAKIIWSNNSRTLGQKLYALQSIPLYFDDCSWVFPDGSQIDSFKTFLDNFILAVEKLLRRFKSTSGGFYSCEVLVLSEDGSLVWEEQKIYFEFWEYALDFVAQLESDVLKVRILRHSFVDDPDGDKYDRTCSVVMSPQRKILDIYGWDALLDDGATLLDQFDALSVSIPTPFARGDILVDWSSAYTPFCGQPVVLDFICDWDKNCFRTNGFKRDGSLIGSVGSNLNQMRYKCFYLSRSYETLFVPKLHSAYGMNYLNLERYQGSSDGLVRLLKAQREELQIDQSTGDWIEPSYRSIDIYLSLVRREISCQKTGVESKGKE